jgi:hypothetical protein
MFRLVSVKLSIVPCGTATKSIVILEYAIISIWF